MMDSNIPSLNSLDSLQSASNSRSFDDSTATAKATSGATSFHIDATKQRKHHPTLKCKQSSSTIQPSKSLYNRQIKLLLSTTIISLISFLYFFLNVYAFITWIIFLSCIWMSCYMTYIYIQHLFHSGEIMWLLPKSTQEYLVDKSLHDVLMDVTCYIYER